MITATRRASLTRHHKLPQGSRLPAPFAMMTERRCRWTRTPVPSWSALRRCRLLPFGEDLVAQPDAFRADPHPRPRDERQIAAALLAAEGTRAFDRLAPPAAAALTDAGVAREFPLDGWDADAELAEHPPRPGSGVESEHAEQVLGADVAATGPPRQIRGPPDRLAGLGRLRRRLVTGLAAAGEQLSRGGTGGVGADAQLL